MQYEFLLSSSLWAHRRSIAFALLVTLLTWTFGISNFVNRANAASLTFVSDTLSSSAPSVVSNHTIQFHNTNAVTNGQTITLTFPSGFSLAALTNVLDFDMGSSTEYTLVNSSIPSTNEWGIDVSGGFGQTITLISGGGSAVIPPNSTTTIKIGLNASSPSVGLHQITNPTNGSYEIGVNATTDSANTRVMILSKVTVTAIVNTAFTFTVAGVNAGLTYNSTTTTATSTATTMPFATTTVGVPNTIAQTLAVTTNARNGFVVTVNADQNLTSATGADIDKFIDNAGTATPVAWVAPTGTIGNENLYGHEGVSSDDTDLNGGEFTTAGPKYAGNFVGNARQVFSNTGPADGAQPNTSLAHVLYTIQISALQEAGNDYTQTLTYVATPTF